MSFQLTVERNLHSPGTDESRLKPEVSIVGIAHPQDTGFVAERFRWLLLLWNAKVDLSLNEGRLVKQELLSELNLGAERTQAF